MSCASALCHHIPLGRLPPCPPFPGQGGVVAWGGRETLLGEDVRKGALTIIGEVLATRRGPGGVG